MCQTKQECAHQILRSTCVMISRNGVNHGSFIEEWFDGADKGFLRPVKSLQVQYDER